MTPRFDWMIEAILNNPKIRNVIDSFPVRNKVVCFIRILLKSILFRRNIHNSHRIIFPGINDAVIENKLILGAGKGDVFINTIANAVSPGTEKGYYLNLPGFHQQRPFIPGYSGCGLVRSDRTARKKFRPGSLVAGVFKHSSWNIVSSESLILVPKNISPRQASFVTLGVIARCGVRTAEIQTDDRVLILGQGILGQLVLQMARSYGAARVEGAALTRSKEKISRQSGIDEFFALSEDGVMPEEIKADRVIDVTGSVDGFETALKMVKPAGRVVMLGSIPGYRHKSDWAQLLCEKQAEIAGAHVRNLEAEGLTYVGEAKAFLNSLASGEVKVDHLITHELTPSEVPDFYRALAEGSISPVGVIIKWQ